MELWNQKTLKSLVLPGGVLLLAASLVFRGTFGLVPAPAISFYYYAVFVAGILLAWRFHSSRVLFALLTLLLAHRAVEFFSAGRMSSAGPGRIAIEAVAFLLPLNFIALSVSGERGSVFPAIVPKLAVLFFESVFVAIICRPGTTTGPGFLHPDFLGKLLSTRIPTVAVLAFVAAVVVLLLRFLLYGKPTESGLLWALLATFFSFQAGGVGPAATAYWATAGLILVSSIIENSYLLAYHDELTTLPARRAFNDDLLHLEAPYEIAVVDIDHFKKFNDTYGHETGDQVLRLVAAKLANVTGGGRAYRVGGEEFSILFRGKSVKDALPHLEQLRAAIGASRFRVRAGEERRSTSRSPDSGGRDSRAEDSRGQDSRRHDFRGNDLRDQALRDRDLRDEDLGGQDSPSQIAKQNDRRRSNRRSETRRTSGSRSRTRPTGVIPESANRDLSVTVSIGVAEPGPGTRAVEQVIESADQALYRAKHSGRNRVEPAHPKPKRNIA
ncbi:MAG: GGDEF domain-containing protein [Terriglobales bacterium]